MAPLGDFTHLESMRLSSIRRNVWSPEAPIHVAFFAWGAPIPGTGPATAFQGTGPAIEFQDASDELTKSSSVRHNCPFCGKREESLSEMKFSLQ